MSKLPQVKPAKMVRVLSKLGFKERKTKGSHRYFKHSDGRWTIVPFHRKPLRKGTLKSILRQIDLPVEELVELL
jgi:predicted RNA binding protein YcfA (HicA-like mRNA interferase family)